MDETWNHQIYKILKFKKGSKYTIEALEEGGKYVQS